MKSLRRRLLDRLGPGLITGAADDDPSGIATYSQAGAQFGFGMLWSVLLTTPLMVGIQIVSARIGLVTGHGIAHNLRQHYPRWLLYATFGKGLDAVRLLDQSIRDNPDQLSLFIGVEWLFNAHRAGFVVHDRAEDRRLAHAYAEQYLKAGGLNEPLVKQWLDVLEREPR